MMVGLGFPKRPVFVGEVSAATPTFGVGKSEVISLIPSLIMGSATPPNGTFTPRNQGLMAGLIEGNHN